MTEQRQDQAFDWSQLRPVAEQAADNAYCPYSDFPVGAAVLCEDGELVPGCNVENASYGLTCCAERHALAAAVARGHKSFKAVLVYTPGDAWAPPCGACRQVIFELLPKDGLVATCNEKGQFQQWRVEELLPAGFEFP